MTCRLWHRLTWLAALAFVLPLLVPGNAGASRRTGLAGNLLIKDADDIFIYPQDNLLYANRVTFDYLASVPPQDAGTLGSGTLLFGNESWVLNFSTHRSDYLNGVVAGYWSGNDRGLFGPRFNPDVNGPTNSVPPGVGRNPVALQWFDVGFGTRMGDARIGARIGSGLDALNTETRPAGGNSSETKNNARILSLQAGATWADWLDVTGEIAFGSSKLENTAPDPDQVLDGSVSQFSVGARAYKEMGGFDWGILGAYSHAGSDFDSLIAGQAQPQEADESINMWMVGIGPVWNDEPQDWQVAGYVTFESQSREFDPPGNSNKTDQRFFTFPGFRIAAERRLWRTIWFRGGVRSDYFFGSTETETPPATTEVFDREYRFRWTAGFSAEVSRFRFEGAFNEPWLTTGPQFLADSSDFLAIATATYFWGETR